MLQDMVLAAVNEAIRSAQELANRKLGGLTGGLDLGGLGLPGHVAAVSYLFAPPVNRLITELSKLPGIGQRTAQRLAFHILRVPEQDALGLSAAIKEVKERIGLCEVCFNLAEGPRCGICQDERRDRSVICVVEEPADVIPIERTHEYRGLYHVLGGALSPIDGVDPEDLKISQLVERVRDGEVQEVVIATNPTTSGEATGFFIARGAARARQGGRRHPARERAAGGRRPRVRGRDHARQGAVRAPRAVETDALPERRSRAARNRRVGARGHRRDAARIRPEHVEVVDPERAGPGPFRGHEAFQALVRGVAGELGPLRRRDRGTRRGRRPGGRSSSTTRAARRAAASSSTSAAPLLVRLRDGQDRASPRLTPIVPRRSRPPASPTARAGARRSRRSSPATKPGTAATSRRLVKMLEPDAEFVPIEQSMMQAFTGPEGMREFFEASVEVWEEFVFDTGGIRPVRRRGAGRARREGHRPRQRHRARGALGARLHAAGWTAGAVPGLPQHRRRRSTALAYPERAMSVQRHHGHEVRRHLGRRRPAHHRRREAHGARAARRAAPSWRCCRRAGRRRTSWSRWRTRSRRSRTRARWTCCSRPASGSPARCARWRSTTSAAEAISLSGSQAGIVTDTSHTKARILDVRADRIRAGLDEGRIVLVAGFQGVSTVARRDDARARRLRHDRGRAGGRAGRRRVRDLHRRGRRVLRRPADRARRAQAARPVVRGDARDVGLGRQGAAAALGRVRAQLRRAHPRTAELRRRLRYPRARRGRDHGTPPHHSRHPLHRGRSRDAHRRARPARHRRAHLRRARGRRRERGHDRAERAGLGRPQRRDLVHRAEVRRQRRAALARGAGRRAGPRRR